MFKTVSGKTCLIDRLKTICDIKKKETCSTYTVMEVDTAIAPLNFDLKTPNRP